jgi:hypothetical protein
VENHLGVPTSPHVSNAAMRDIPMPPQPRRPVPSPQGRPTARNILI